MVVQRVLDFCDGLRGIVTSRSWQYSQSTSKEMNVEELPEFTSNVASSHWAENCPLIQLQTECSPNWTNRMQGSQLLSFDKTWLWSLSGFWQKEDDNVSVPLNFTWMGVTITNRRWVQDPGRQGSENYNSQSKGGKEMESRDQVMTACDLPHME